MIAITGATGFIGRPLLAELLGRGHAVKALVRRPDALAARSGLAPVIGDLDDIAALKSLVADVDCVIHLAGRIAAPDAQAFMTANVEGSQHLATAISGSSGYDRPLPRVIAVSSLAAREPSLSPYAESKAGGERAFDSLPDVVVVRPPAVYGPGDKGTLPIFQQLVGGWLLSPAGQHRFSLIHVDDMVSLLTALALGQAGLPGRLIEPDDGMQQGYAWDDLARIAGNALKRRVRCLRVPRPVFGTLGWAMELGGRWLGRTPPVDRGKVAELFHPDWRVDRTSQAGLSWRPKVGFALGFATTLAWYRSAGWIKADATR